MISELFSQVLSRRIALSDDERLVACAILNDRLVDSYNPTDAQRAALAIATVRETPEGDSFARMLASIFRDDIEVLAGVCMALVRTMSVPWDGTVASLEASMLTTPRSSAVLEVLIQRLVEDLRTGHDSPGWKLSGKGRLFLDQINDVELLAAIAERSQSNRGALLRLAHLGAVDHLVESCVYAPPWSVDVWIDVLSALPAKPASIERLCDALLATRLSTRVRNDLLEAREQVLLDNRPDLFDSQSDSETFLNHAGR